MHHHSQVLLSRCLFFFGLCEVCKGSLRVKIAQTIRAVLLAIAKVATRAGYRSSNDVSHQCLKRDGNGGFLVRVINALRLGQN